MPNVTLHIATPLRRFAEGAEEVALQADTVGAAFIALGHRYPALTAQMQSPDGALRRFIIVFLGAENIDTLDGMDTPLKPGDEVWIITAVAGGTSRTARERSLEELRKCIAQVTPAQAETRQAAGALLIDVREQDELAEGSPRGALALGRGFLEMRIEDLVPALDQPLLLICDGGNRSLFAASDLLRLGYTDVRSVSGGLRRWKDEGRPLGAPPALSGHQRDRYARHLLIPEVGEAGQLALLKARVLLVGAGGLGSPVALYLAAAGVGTLGIVDHDVVARSNLQRQILHTEARIGSPKTASARASLLALNPEITVDTYETRLDSQNVEQVFSRYQLIVDGTDNFATRYLINDACVKLGLPNVHGAIARFEGQVSVFWPADPAKAGSCYRCLYPEAPPAELAPSCAQGGVLGVLPGVIGLLQAVEVIKLLLGIGDSLVGRMLCYDALKARFRELTLRPDPACPNCAAGAVFQGYADERGNSCDTP
jgi:sulfur-carrier protein adenylyltransferase/sulfurtransferase